MYVDVSNTYINCIIVICPYLRPLATGPHAHRRARGNRPASPELSIGRVELFSCALIAILILPLYTLLRIPLDTSTSGADL